MSSLPHPLHPMSRLLTPVNLPSPSPEVVNIGERLGKNSSRDRILGTLKWQRAKQTLISREGRVMKRLRELWRALARKVLPCSCGPMMIRLASCRIPKFLTEKSKTFGKTSPTLKGDSTASKTNGIFALNLIQRHVLTRPLNKTWSTLVKSLVPSTSRPALNPFLYRKIIGATTSSRLLPLTMNQQSGAMSLRTLSMTTCIFVSALPVPQSSSHPSQVQGTGKKFVSFWPTRHLLLTRAIKQPSPTSSGPCWQVGLHRGFHGI